MMKKHIMILIAVLALVSIVSILYIKTHQVRLDPASDGIAIFNYAGVNNIQPMEREAVEIIYNLFDGKMLYYDSPSCGFDDEISVRFDNSQTFCFACDGCPVIYWKEKNMYFRLSSSEQQELYNLLDTYGFQFPCI